MKTCTKCQETKPLDRFFKQKAAKDGFQAHCKLCMKAYYEANKEKICAQRKTYRESNKEKIAAYRESNKEKISAQKKTYRQANKEKIAAYRESNKEKTAARNKAYYEANKEKRSAYKKAYYEANKEKICANVKAYQQANREKINARTRKRRKHDVQFRLSTNLRGRLRAAMKNAQKSGSGLRNLGCTIPELKQHLESQFTEGMTWNNWAHDGWHIDHIKPLALFDLTDRKQFLEACHYTNLQPLWAEENFSKGATIQH